MILLTTDRADMAHYLSTAGYLEDREAITAVTIPGDGNMNFTLRITTDRRSFIVKQSRPYVEKYPQVAAPEDRCLREAEFYELVTASDNLSAHTPTVYHVDADNHIIIMEDLGAGEDYTSVYGSGVAIDEEDLESVVDLLIELHGLDTGPRRITNQSMRQLNHEHMYVYPFVTDNGLDLDTILPGLAAVARPYQEDSKLRAAVAAIGQRYLEDGQTLLHGDYFLGSWLRSADKVYIIDPEFCFHGFAEFEVGVMVAHLLLAQQDTAMISRLIVRYTAHHSLDIKLLYQCVGIEIMRRIMGLAQLPLGLDLDRRAQLLARAQRWILGF